MKDEKEASCSLIHAYLWQSGNYSVIPSSCAITHELAPANAEECARSQAETKAGTLHDHPAAVRRDEACGDEKEKERHNAAPQHDPAVAPLVRSESAQSCTCAEAQRGAHGRSGNSPPGEIRQQTDEEILRAKRLRFDAGRQHDWDLKACEDDRAADQRSRVDE